MPAKPNQASIAAGAIAKGLDKDIKFVASDYDPTNDELRTALRGLGIYVYNDPRYWDTDMYGCILSKRKLTQREIKQLTKEAI